MKGNFGDRVDELQKAVGRGKLRGTVEVNQIYAHYQHAHPEFYHPDGGKAFYLQDPLFAKQSDFMEHMAEHAIKPEGSQIKEAMVDNMEHLSQAVYDEAPWEFGDLRASGHPKVEDGEDVFYDREPYVHRLTKEEIRIKNELSRLLDPHRYLRN